MKGKSNMTIMTFGSQKGRQRHCEVVSVGIQKVHGRSKELTLLTVLSICEPITRSPLQLCFEQFGYLKDLELAYPPTDSDTTNPDILIGMDHYWDLVTGEVIQRVGGPVAMHTHLG